MTPHRVSFGGLVLVASALGALGCSIDERDPSAVDPSRDASTLQPSAGNGGASGATASPESTSGAGGDAGTPAACEGEACAAACLGCLIEGACVGAGESPAGNTCQVCDPERSPSAWSNVEGECDDGLFCTTGDACSAGSCNGDALACDDGVACNGVSACVEDEDRCAPGVNQCAGGELCDVGLDACVTTCAGCLIEGICLPEGSELPGNPCLVCDTARSTTAYSAAAGGKPCGAGASECSGADTCDGAGACQPNHLSTSTVCGSLPASCAGADRCNGAGGCQSRAGDRVEVCDGIDNDCDGTTDEGFNLNSDPNHCGACGHSCLGGACNAGQCQLRILADLGARQFQLKVVGDTIYSSDSGSFNRAVHRLRRDGSSVEPNIGLALGGLRSFDIDGSFFYIWRNFSAEIFLTSCDPATQGSSCANATEEIQLPMTLDRTTSGSSVVTDRAGHRVFWYNAAENVTYVSPTGSFARTPVVGNFQNADFIYANDALWGPDATDGTRILRVPATGDFPSTVAVEAGAFGFAANSTRIFWIAGNHISFINQPFGNGAAPPNAFSGPASPQALAVDDASVYWVESVSTGDVVKRCPVTGCPAGGPVTMTAPIIEALGLAVDDRAVYIAAGTATRVGGEEIPGGVLLVAK